MKAIDDIELRHVIAFPTLDLDKNHKFFDKFHDEIA